MKKYGLYTVIFILFLIVVYEYILIQQSRSRRSSIEELLYSQLEKEVYKNLCGKGGC